MLGDSLFLISLAVSATPAWASVPAMTSVSTRFLAQPRLMRLRSTGWFFIGCKCNFPTAAFHPDEPHAAAGGKNASHSGRGEAVATAPYPDTFLNRTSGRFSDGGIMATKTETAAAKILVIDDEESICFAFSQ